MRNNRKRGLMCWRSYLPELSLNVQFGPASNRTALTVYCSLRQRLANVSLERMPTEDEIWSTPDADGISHFGSYPPHICRRSGGNTPFGVN